MLLRNDRGVLPLARPPGFADAVRLYVVVHTALGSGSGIRVVHSPEEATHALPWVRPAISLLDDAPDSELSVALDEATGVDVDRVVTLEAALPTVVAVDFANPWLADASVRGRRRWSGRSAR